MKKLILVTVIGGLVIAVLSWGFPPKHIVKPKLEAKKKTIVKQPPKAPKIDKSGVSDIKPSEPKPDDEISKDDKLKVKERSPYLFIVKIRDKALIAIPREEFYDLTTKDLNAVATLMAFSKLNPTEKEYQYLCRKLLPDYVLE
jgi:hypothetical protein